VPLRRLVMFVAIATALTAIPPLSVLDQLELYSSAWAKGGGGKGGGGSKGGGGGGGNGGSDGSGKGSESSYGSSKYSSANHGQKGSSAIRATSHANLDGKKGLVPREASPTEASLLEVLEARKKVEEATKRFNKALGEPKTELEPFLLDIGKARQVLIAAGNKHQTELARQTLAVAGAITNSTKPAIQESSP
jgi:hypothetical protein